MAAMMADVFTARPASLQTLDTNLCCLPGRQATVSPQVSARVMSGRQLCQKAMRLLAWNPATATLPWPMHFASHQRPSDRAGFTANTSAALDLRNAAMLSRVVGPRNCQPEADSHQQRSSS